MIDNGSLSWASRRLRDIIPLIFWMAIIFLLSAQPVLLEFQNEASEKIFNKLAHVLVYAVLAWLWWRALSAKRQTTWPVLFTALALAILYGISDEYHQSFVPGRHARVSDVLFDTSGALAMILLIRAAERRQHKWPVLANLISI
ncbi:MAG: VanZ family protein [Anaerolineae bacterium]|nr:VanZ family protein [Anaerolineae bacterium]